MNRFLWKSLHIFLTLLAGLLILTLLLIGIASTQTGFKSILMLTKPWLNQQGIDYRTEHMQGDLYRFVLPVVSLKTSHMDFEANGLEVSWAPWELFRKRLIITHAYIQTLQLTPGSGSPAAHPPNLNTWSLQINQVQVAHIQWKTPDSDISLGTLKTKLLISSSALHVNSLDFTGPLGTLRGQFRLDTEGAQNTTGNLDWSLTLPLSTPLYTSGHLGLTGTLAQYHLRLNALLQEHDRETLLALEAQGDTQHLKITTLALKQPPPAENQNAPTGSLAMTGTVIWSPTLNWALSFKADQLDLSPWIKSLSQPLSGTIKSYRTQTQEAFLGTLEEPPYTLALNLKGNLQGKTLIEPDPVWQDTVDSLTFSDSPEDIWQLSQPAPFQHSPDFLMGKLSQLCLHTSLSKLCLDAQWNRKNWTGALNGQNLRIPDLPSFLQTGENTLALTMAGTEGHITQAHLTGTLSHYTLTPISQFNHQGPSDNTLSHNMLIDIIHGTFELTLDHQRLTCVVEIPKSNLGFLQSQLSIENTQDPNSPLTGSLRLHLTDLSPLTAWAPWMYHLEGNIAGDVQLSGTRRSPQLEGEINFTDGAITLPSLGLELQHIFLTLSGDHTKRATLSGQFTSGEGQVRMTGAFTQLYPTPHFTLHFEGNNVTLLDLPLGFVVGSPNLTYRQTQSQSTGPVKGRLTGTLSIPKAFFNGDAFHLDAAASSDILYVNQDDQVLEAHAPFPFFSDLSLNFGPDVTFEGFGVSAKVAGQVTLLSGPQQPAMGIGKLTSQGGTYQAYGKIFHITQGTLDFAHSPLEDPGIDITAQYQLSPDGASNHLLTQLQVGVRMTGTLTHRILTLFSNPALSQEDILSYIVLGQPMSQIQQSDQSALSKAAALFVLQGGNRSVLTDVQSKLGLSQLTIGSLDNGYTNSNGIPVQSGTHLNGQGSTENNNTAVFIGKSLNPNLYLSYGVGLFNRQQEVSLSLNLDQHWTLKTTGASQDSGVDLIYTILKK